MSGRSIKRILDQKFFNRDTILVAKELLGKTLVRKIRGKEMKCIITETEVYDGFYDKASHASRGKTKRNIIMFGPAGYWYIYFTYGMHWMLNIVTREKEYPAAILIRGAVTEDGRILNGPAKLTKFLHIDRKLNGKKAEKKNNLWFEKGGEVPRLNIKMSARIGINYAGMYWSKRKLRFYY